MVEMVSSANPPRVSATTGMKSHATRERTLALPYLEIYRINSVIAEFATVLGDKGKFVYRLDLCYL